MLRDTTLYSSIYLVYFLLFLAGVQENRKCGLMDVGLCLYGHVCSLSICQRKQSVEIEILEHCFPTFMIGKPPWVWSAQWMEPRSKPTSGKDSALGGAQGAQGRLHAGRYLSDAQIRIVTSWLSFTWAADDLRASTLVIVTSSHLKGRVNPDPVPGHQG